MTTESDMPLHQPDENEPYEQLLNETGAYLNDVRAVLERLIQENEKLRARLAEERRSRKSAVLALASFPPGNPADIEQPTYLAQCVIVIEPLPSRDDMRGPIQPS